MTTNESQCLKWNATETDLTMKGYIPHLRVFPPYGNFEPLPYGSVIEFYQQNDTDTPSILTIKAFFGQNDADNPEQQDPKAYAAYDVALGDAPISTPTEAIKPNYTAEIGYHAMQVFQFENFSTSEAFHVSQTVEITFTTWKMKTRLTLFVVTRRRL